MRTIVKNEELLDLAEKKTGMYMVDRQLSSLSLGGGRLEDTLQDFNRCTVDVCWGERNSVGTGPTMQA